MKKNLIALAIFGAFTGAAFAQSNVTLYGIVDGGLQYNGTNVLNTTTKAIESKSQFGVDGGYVAGNRFGLRGAEALGGGTSAIFQIESGFNIDNGMS
ncbi:MAG: porin, partial [Burkholderiaceae bacterium]